MSQCVSLYPHQLSKHSIILSVAFTKKYVWLAATLGALFLLRIPCTPVFAAHARSPEKTTLTQQTEQHSAATKAEGGKEIVLDGRNLSIEDVVRVARQRILVKAHPDALERVRRSHELLLLAAREGHPVYGLNGGWV
jgi:hypothetical protein